MTIIMNCFPELADATRAIKGHDAGLLEVGRRLSTLHVEELLGLVLLHRHYEIDESEIVVQISADDRSALIVCRAEETSGHHPTSWCRRSDTPDISAFEYTVIEPDEDYARAIAALPAAFAALREAGLEDRLGLLFLPAQPASDLPLYEQTSERARISIVTPWRDLDTGQGVFARSVMAFRCEGQEVRFDDSKNCRYCPNCQPSVPASGKPQESVEFHVAGRMQSFPVARFTLDATPALLRRMG